MSEAHDKSTGTEYKKRNVVMLACGVLGVALITLLITQLNRPERSVTAYCKVYGQEKTRLSAMSNHSNPYPSGVFNVSVTDAGEIASSLGKLESLAPNEIAPMLSSLQKLYQDIHDNPSHGISNALNGGSLDDNLKAWTRQHCDDK